MLDPDVTEGFPHGFLSFVHHAGPGSVCIPPGPPVGCHRYFVVTYSDGCDPFCPLVTGEAAALAGKRDLAGNFDRGNGVLLACRDCVKGVSVTCWAAPALEPVQCSCPGAYI